MDFQKHLETAWRLTIKYIVPLILMTLVMFIVDFLTLGILTMVTLAGYMHAILLLVREGREPKIQDIFSQMRLFLPLFAFSVVVFILTLIGFLLLLAPGVIFSLAVTFFCIYMLPLMTDRRMGMIDAIKTSAAISLQKPVAENIVVVVLYIGICVIGGSVFIGFLFTQPFATIFLLSVYEEKMTR
ncbi:MAG: hypothetical protein GY859_00735 [Desulfobacterales bacterium]|nr:hypothetical protein [Desulfobacterales bacterium]